MVRPEELSDFSHVTSPSPRVSGWNFCLLHLPLHFPAVWSWCQEQSPQQCGVLISPARSDAFSLRTFTPSCLSPEREVRITLTLLRDEGGEGPVASARWIYGLPGRVPCGSFCISVLARVTAHKTCLNETRWKSYNVNTTPARQTSVWERHGQKNRKRKWTVSQETLNQSCCDMLIHQEQFASFISSGIKTHLIFSRL